MKKIVRTNGWHWKIRKTVHKIISRNMMMNWCNILTAKQNRVQRRDLIYKAMKNRKFKNK